MATATDATTLATLQGTLNYYNTILTGDGTAANPGLINLDNQAKQKLANDQAILANLVGDPNMLKIQQQKTMLSALGKWGAKNSAGQYYFVDRTGNLYADASSNQEYINASTSLQSWENQKTAAQQAITQDQANVNSFEDPVNGTLTQAQNSVAKAQQAIDNFVPTTAQGQANAVTISNNAAQTAAAQQATASANAQQARDAASQQANIATSNTQTYIIIAVVLIVIIMGLVFYFRYKKKKAA